MRHGKWFILKKNRGLFHVEKVVKKRKTRFPRLGRVENPESVDFAALKLT